MEKPQKVKIRNKTFIEDSLSTQLLSQIELQHI